MVRPHPPPACSALLRTASPTRARISDAGTSVVQAAQANAPSRPGRNGAHLLHVGPAPSVTISTDPDQVNEEVVADGSSTEGTADAAGAIVSTTAATNAMAMV